MENAADALKMAGAVLLFVMALSIIILSFGQVGEASDAILNYKDRETSYNYTTGYWGNRQGDKQFSRVVSLETIIPSIYRAYLENYIIVFEGLNEPIYKLKQQVGSPIEKFTIDLKTQGTENNATVADNEAKAKFIRAILYRDYEPNEFKNDFPNVSFEGISDTLYKQLERAVTITEFLGVYYQNDNPNVPEVMKEKKRIITYRLEY